MKIGCGQACACLSYCYESAKQSLAAAVSTLNEIRKNPETFQKTCIIAGSIIQGINFTFRTKYLPELVRILDTAQELDFYGFCRIPFYIFHPYVPERIDEYAVLDQLETILCKNWEMGKPDGKGKLRAPIVRKFAKGRLEELLEMMDEFDYDLRTENEFKKILKNHLVKYLEEYPKLYSRDEFDPGLIDIGDLKVDLKPSSFLQVLSDAIFMVVDIACVPSFLQEWSLIDLSYFSYKGGSTSIFGQLLQKSLDDWIRGAMCLGFLFQIMEAFRSLYIDPLTHGERNNAKRIIGAAIAECLYNGAILLKRDLRLITFFAFVAKSLGLVQILLIPKTSFFNAK